MSWGLSALVILGLLIFFLLLSLPVSISLMVVILVGYMFDLGLVKGTDYVIFSFFQSLAKFSFTPIPIFIITGTLLFHSGLALRCIEGISKWFGSVPARLSFLAIASGTVFGAISGSTIASTAVLTSVLYPEMREKHYSKVMSVGPILASGGLAMIIPPSTLSVVFAAIAQISVAGVLIAGILPGILMAIGYCVVILIYVKFNPAHAPTYNLEVVIPWKERIKSLLVDVIPVTSIILLMILFIFFGIATPTESASVGLVASLILVLIYKEFKLPVFIDTLKLTAETSGTIFFIGLMADSFSRLLAFSGISSGFVKWVLSFQIAPIMTVIAILLVVVVLGCFLDQISIMMITIPLAMPVINTLGYNSLWFAMLMLIALQIGLTTPPFGLNLFVVKSIIKDIKMRDLYGTVLPFLLSDATVIALLILFPSIVLILPMLMGL